MRKYLVATVTLMLAILAISSPVEAAECTWVDGGTIGNVYTDWVDDVWYVHSAVFIWNGDTQPIVDSFYYWVNDDWMLIPKDSIITYDGTYQLGPNNGWWGYYIETRSTVLNPWFNGEEGNWNDDWRWGAYINC